MKKKQLFVFVVGLVFASYVSAMDLCKAVESNNTEWVRFFLRGGADTNVCDEQGTPLLHLAAVKNQKEVARLLIEGGADVDVLNERGQTVFDIANTEVAKVIKETKETMDRLKEIWSDKVS